MLKTASVSVIMNCLNCEKYLRQAIDSIYAQTYKDWEIIFWDNASTDESLAIAKNYDERLRYFRAYKTVPLYAARNLALRQARGRYVAFLDCDDSWLPDKLNSQVRAFEQKKKLGLIHTNVEILENTGSKRILHKKVQPSGKIFNRLLKNYNINLQTVMISREALNSQDYWFDESMSISGDADLFLRISYEWEVLYLPVVLAQYREHGTSLSATKIDKIIAENEKILITLSKKNANFMNNYKAEVKKFRIRSVLSVAVAKWKYCGGREARKYIKKNFTSNVFIFLFLIFFLPFKTFVNIRNLFFR